MDQHLPDEIKGVKFKDAISHKPLRAKTPKSRSSGRRTAASVGILGEDTERAAIQVEAHKQGIRSLSSDQRDRRDSDQTLETLKSATSLSYSDTESTTTTDPAQTEAELARQQEELSRHALGHERQTPVPGAAELFSISAALDARIQSIAL